MFLPPSHVAAKPGRSLLAPPTGPGIRPRVLSLCAGVQSTTLALMAAHGEIGPMPDCAIFADTGWEPKAVYEHLHWLRSGNVLPFPIHIVSAGNIRDDLVAGARAPLGLDPRLHPHRAARGYDRACPRCGRRNHRSAHAAGHRGRRRHDPPPMHLVLQDRADPPEGAGTGGTARRRLPTTPVVEQWIGISLDEAIRMKPSFEDWQVSRWPLGERGMTRRDCLRWLEWHDYPLPPRSACIGYPFHLDAVWRRMRDTDPEAWSDAVDLDRIIRTGFRGLRGDVYLHRSAVPLDEADLSTDTDRGQLDFWPDECEGLCGV